MTDLKELMDDLDAKGSAEGIAEFFAAKGVVGEVNCCWQCAVANYLSNRTKKTVMVGHTHVSAFHDNGQTRDEVSMLGAYGNILAFISQFDSGSFPNLVCGYQ